MSDGPGPASGLLGSARELVERALSGEDRKLARLAAAGLLPIPPEDLVPVQIALATRADEEVAASARSSLAAHDGDRVARLIQHGAPVEVLTWFARASDDSRVLEAILRRRDVPRDLLPELAARLSPQLQEILLLRQDAILERPEILEGLERNADLSPYSRRRILELRAHLLRRGERPAVGGSDEPGDEEVLEAIERVRSAAPAGDDDRGERERDQQTGLTDLQIRMLPVPIRRKLARGAPRALRGILLRDQNPQVAVAALTEGGISDGEVEQIAANRSVVGEVLEEIARRRDWVSKLKVVSALVHNPRTPAGIAVRLLTRLSARELGALARDHNVSSAVRTQAGRLYRMRRR